MKEKTLKQETFGALHRRYPCPCCDAKIQRGCHIRNQHLDWLEDNDWTVYRVDYLVNCFPDEAREIRRRWEKGTPISDLNDRIFGSALLGTFLRDYTTKPKAEVERKKKDEWARKRKVTEDNKTPEQKKAYSQKQSDIHKNRSPEVEAERVRKISAATKRSQKKLVKEGNHNWLGERPCNNPTERVYDLPFIPIFLADTNHNFKVEERDGREFQLDFVSWLLHFGIEADEPDHEREENKIWDQERDKYIVDSKELDFTYRFTTKYSITNMVDVIKKVYDLANQQLEKYKLYDLSILKFDDRLIPYCEQMQELLKEWLYSKERSRFKIFREKKREIDKKWLNLFEEIYQNQTNFVEIYRETLEKDQKLSFKKVKSIWRNNGF